MDRTPPRRKGVDAPGRGGPPSPADSPVARALLQRGLGVSECERIDRTFLPYIPSLRDRETFFRRLESYAFRLFLRDLLALRDRYSPERLGPFFTPAAVEEMAAQAQELGLIRRGARREVGFRADGVTDFGDTFEWFVAETLRRRFAAAATWGVKISGLPCGGDFDVLALVSGKLLYVETKTSPPKHIEQKDMTAFLSRVRILSPDLAIVLVDTHLRMKDKIVPLLAEALRAEGAKDAAMRRVERETFAWGRRLLVTNAKRDVAGNLALCLRSYFLGGFFG